MLHIVILKLDGKYVLLSEPNVHLTVVTLKQDNLFDSTDTTKLNNKEVLMNQVSGFNNFKKFQNNSIKSYKVQITLINI